MRRGALALALMLSVLPAAVRAATPEAEEGSAWDFAVYLDAYLQSGESAYFIPTVFADRESLHLEARYNYEAEDAASVFAGWSFAFGGEADYVELTPMVGGIAGGMNGVAPGLEVEARWGRVAYWLEAEYVFDLEDSSGNYLYTWSELNVYALPWLWVGGSLQRIKEIETATEVDVGPMVGVGKAGTPGWSLSFYAYGISTSTPSYLLTGAVQF